MLQLLWANAVSTALFPRRNERSLQAWLASTYTTNRNNQCSLIPYFAKSRDLLCSPELMPQIVGGDRPLGLVTTKESVRHLEALFKSFPVVPVPIWPQRPLPSDACVSEPVDGPVMTKVSKSNLNYITFWNKWEVRIWNIFITGLLDIYCCCICKFSNCNFRFRCLLTRNTCYFLNLWHRNSKQLKWTRSFQ